MTGPSRTISHAAARAVLARVGTDPKRIKQILADYPDPIDLTVAEESLFRKYGLTGGGLADRMGGSP